MLTKTTSNRLQGTIGTDVVVRAPRPVAELALALLAVTSFKVFLFIQMGVEAHVAALSDLSQGNLLQQVIARLLTLDEVSLFLVDTVRGFAF